MSVVMVQGSRIGDRRAVGERPAGALHEREPMVHQIELHIRGIISIHWSLTLIVSLESV